MDKNKFLSVVPLIVKSLEGGYYNPLMINRSFNGVKDSIYFHAGPGRVESGETLYGLDRINGGYLNTGTYGKLFWGLVDGAGASVNWPYDYRGGTLAPQLMQYLGLIMYPNYNNEANTYLSSAARQLVDSDLRLVLHFAYASWNGALFFKNFAAPINDAVARGITNTDTLAKIALDSRIYNTNTLIQRTSDNIAIMMSSLRNVVSSNPLTTFLLFAAIAGGGYYYYRSRK